MDVETLAPIAISPLDGCRGRGRCSITPRMKSTRQRNSPTDMNDTPKSIILFIPEYSPKVGAVNIECNMNKSTTYITKK